MQGDVVPALNAGGIRSEGGECRQSSQQVRVPREDGIFDLLPGLQKKHGKGNSRKRLPELRNFVVDEGDDEGRTGEGEESAKESLIGVVAPCRPLRGEIEGCGDDGQREDTHAEVRGLRRFAVQIHRQHAIHGQQTEQTVLHLQVKRLELLSKRREKQHDSGEGEGGPICGEQRPGGRGSGECSDVRVGPEHGRIREMAEELAPSASQIKCVCIEDHGA